VTSSSRIWLGAGLLLLAAAYFSFGWEFFAADRELRSARPRWWEPALLVTAAACFVVAALRRRRRDAR